MIMHPYRRDLVGKDVSDYADSNGKFLFREAVRIAENDGRGYVDYMWQWQDDPSRIVPKISYVETFTPWRWIVGTGIYIEDVLAEIATLSHRLAILSGLTLLLIMIFSGYYIWQWIKTENKRHDAWQALAESREKYMAVLASSPNPVVVYDDGGKVLYINPAFTRVFGWELPELIGQRIDFVPEACLQETQDAIQKAYHDGYYAFDTRRRTKDGSEIFVRINAATYRLSDGTTRRHGGESGRYFRSQTWRKPNCGKVKPVFDGCMKPRWALLAFTSVDGLRMSTRRSPRLPVSAKMN